MRARGSWSIGRVLVHSTIATILFCSGCCIHRPQQTTSEKPAELVDVGGLVAWPQALAIPDGGLLLRQAIIRAGGLRGAGLDPNLPTSEVLVALQRGRGAGIVTHYFPLEMAERDLVGDVPLFAGDVVRLVPLRESSLVRLSPAAGSTVGEFSVLGLVNRPGNYRLGAEIPVAAGGGGSANSLSHVLPLAGSISYDPPPTVLVLERTPASGLGREHYVLPLPNSTGLLSGSSVIPASATAPSVTTPPQRAANDAEREFTVPETGSPRAPENALQGPDLPLSAAMSPTPAGMVPAASLPPAAFRSVWQLPISHGDSFTATRLELVPVVLTGIATNIARQKFDEQKRCLKRLQDLREEREKDVTDAPACVTVVKTITAPLRAVASGLINRDSK